tara:strand:+ start:220 stop:411 length:192 start_codon:yes stop_codon:yes gene_type:complete
VLFDNELQPLVRSRIYPEKEINVEKMINPKGKHPKKASASHGNPKTKKKNTSSPYKKSASKQY